MVAFVVFYMVVWFIVIADSGILLNLAWPNLIGLKIRLASLFASYFKFRSELKTWLGFKIGFYKIFWPQFYFYYFFTFLMILLMFLIIYVQFIFTIPVDGLRRPICFCFFDLWENYNSKTLFFNPLT